MAQHTMVALRVQWSNTSFRIVGLLRGCADTSSHTKAGDSPLVVGVSGANNNPPLFDFGGGGDSSMRLEWKCFLHLSKKAIRTIASGP